MASKMPQGGNYNNDAMDLLQGPDSDSDSSSPAPSPAAAMPAAPSANVSVEKTADGFVVNVRGAKSMADVLPAVTSFFGGGEEEEQPGSEDEPAGEPGGDDSSAAGLEP